MTTATTARGPTAAEILGLLASIDRYPANAPATLAFRNALACKGREINAAGGLAALKALGDAVASANPTRADARMVILRAAWADLLPGPGEKAPS